MTPDWAFQFLWFGAGIGGTGALWYFLSQRQYHAALWVGFFTVVAVCFTITLHIRNDLMKHAPAVPDGESAVDVRPRLVVERAEAISADALTNKVPGKNDIAVRRIWFAMVTFKNDALRPGSTADAKAVTAQITFFNGDSVIKSLVGIWERNPTLARADTVFSDDSTEASFGIGQRQKLNLAFKWDEDDSAYGISRQSGEVFKGQIAGLAIAQGRRRVVVELYSAASRIKESFTFTMSHGGRDSGLTFDVAQSTVRREVREEVTSSTSPPTSTPSSESVASPSGPQQIPPGMSTNRSQLPAVLTPAEPNARSVLAPVPAPPPDPPPDATSLAAAYVSEPAVAPNINLERGDILILDQRGVTWYRPSTKTTKPVAAVGLLRFPRGIAIERDGQILVTDPGAFEGSLIRIDPKSGKQSAFSRREHLNTSNHPFGVAIERSGSILVTTTNAGSIVRVDPNDGAQRVLVPAGGILRSPRGITLDERGTIYVADDHGQVVRVNPNNGNVTPITAGNRLQSPMGIVLTPRGVIVTDGSVKALIRVNPATAEQELLGEAGTLAAPFGLAATERGDLLVADEGGVVYQIDAKTGVATRLLSEGLRGPIGIAVVGAINR